MILYIRDSQNNRVNIKLIYLVIDFGINWLALSVIDVLSAAKKICEVTSALYFIGNREARSIFI